MLEKRWVAKKHPPKAVIEKLSEQLGVGRVLATLIAQRNLENFEDAKLYFNPEYDQLHDPFLMHGMQAAVERIDKAIEKGEKVMVYGDYDVDGTTAVALTYGYFKGFFNEISYYIPDRFSEGYGISDQGILTASEQKVSLIIALDCGIKALKQAELAKKQGIDLIICDHHTPGEKLPEAMAILNPKQEHCNYPYKELPGCAIGFKLIQAFNQYKGLAPEKCYAFLDLVAAAIASDIVPITGENRVLAHYGLIKVAKDPVPGIKALKETNNLKEGSVQISDMVFKIGPRINAAGRIASALDAVALLSEQNVERAMEMAVKVNLNNRKRQGLDQSITEEALSMIASDEVIKARKSTVLFNPDWHKGVIGIVASRVIERHFKPTILLTESNGLAVGSARSVPGFDLYHAIDQCSHLLEQFGGHKAAAGLSIQKDKVQEFAIAFDEVVSANIEDDMLIPAMYYDLEMHLDEVNSVLCKNIQRLGPFGPENMQPVFVSKKVSTKGNARLINDKHLKLSIHQDNGNVFNAIGFNMSEFYKLVNSGRPYDICYTIDENIWRGNLSYQFRIKDIKDID